MAGVQLGIRIDDRQVREVFRKAPQAAVRRLGELIEGATIDTQGEMRKQINVGATGRSRRSIRYVVHRRAFKGEVIADFAHAMALEHGSRPHWTSARPGSDLHRWAKHKGLNPYAVQRSIAKKGTKAHPFVKPTYNTMRPRVQRDIINGMAAFARSLNNGQV